MTSASSFSERSALELCARMPFISSHEISALSGASLTSVREELRDLHSFGHIDFVSYASAEGCAARRWHLRSSGASALAGLLNCDIQSLLSVYPISLHWRRKIARRIDAAAVFYAFAASASVALGCRCEWRWRNSGWNDGCLALGDGRFIHAARIGGGVPRAALASRLGSMVEEANSFKVDTALFIASSYTDMRYIERWLRDKARGIYAWVAHELDVVAGRNDAAVWTRPSTLWVRQSALIEFVSNVGALSGAALALADGLDGVRGASGRRLPIDSSELKRELTHAALSAADKRLLAAVADWPLASIGDLALIANMRRSMFFSARRSLIGLGLITDVWVEGRMRCVLTDEGLRAISWRDRVGLGALRSQWRSEFAANGRLIGGGRLTALWKKIAHTDGAYKFAGTLSAECAETEDVELLELLPEHRSERWFAQGKRRPFGVCPDVSGALRFNGRIAPFLVEYERRGIAPSLIVNKLRSYQRYYRASLSLESWDVEPLTLFVFSDSAMASRFVNFCERDEFDLSGSGGVKFPIYASSVEEVEALGAFGQVWFRVSEAGRGRVGFLNDYADPPSPVH